MTNLDQGYRDIGSLAEGDVHDVDGHAVAVDFPHDVLDGYRTDWGQRCWDESFARRLPVMVWNHNADLLIGAGVRGEFLQRTNVSRVVARFANFDKVPKAAEAHSMIEDKIVPGFSFHYRNGRSIAHPTERGARRYTKADMMELSPVTFPSLPGAQAVGIRAEEATMAIPTLSEIMKLRDDGLTNEEGFRALVAEHYPQIREHIVVQAPKPPVLDEAALEGIRAELTEKYGEDGVRHLVLSLEGSGAGGGDDGSSGELAGDVDAALDAAAALLDGTDMTTLPDNVQQALHLVNAAGTAVDELLEVMGVADPDEDGEGGRSLLSAEQRDKLSDSDFAYIDAKGGRHLPIQDAAHVRDALSRFDETHFDSAEDKTAAHAKVEAAAKKFGIDAGQRSEPAEARSALLGELGKRLGVA